MVIQCLGQVAFWVLKPLLYTKEICPWLRKSWRVRNGPATGAAICLAAAAAAGDAAFVRLADVANYYGFPAPEERANRVICRSKYSTIEFEANTRRMFYNGLLLYMNGALTGGSGRWILPEHDASTVIDPLLRRDAVAGARRCDAIVLDPGHGGADKGASTRKGLEEKQVTLDIARRVRQKLRGCGVSVFLTRERDRFVSLDNRTILARKVGADLFVSIHANWSGNPTVSGIETFVPSAQGFPSTSATEPGRMGKAAYPANRHDAANTLVAYYIQKGLVAYVRAGDRGVKRARYQVIRDAPCPAVLVECGFLSNAQEESRLSTREYRDAVADGIARGILTYVNAANRAQLTHR